MRKNKKTSLYLTITAILLALFVLGWFLTGVFEGEKPKIVIHPLPEYCSTPLEFNLAISDMKRGLKNVRVSLNQEGRDISILNIPFPFEGLFNREGTHQYDTKFSIDPSQLNLAQGRVDLSVRVWDHSRRNGGDGNMSLLQHNMTVDTIPPSIRAVSRQHYINVGGTGIVIYQTSSDSLDSGVFVNDIFFKGFPANEGEGDGYHVCYFTVPVIHGPNPLIYLWTEDRAGNRSESKFYFHVRRKKFRTEKINITDRFLNQIFPNFSAYGLPKDLSASDKFLKINQDMRKESARTFYDLRTKTSPNQLWAGKWLRMKNAANMAHFGDRRLYIYKGKQIDKQTHMGVDLASLAHSEVQATNNGVVIFAKENGIYGNTVVIDHGQGLASVCSHLSQIVVMVGQEVLKGDVIGRTGQTGLAGGDHLHFAVLVNGVFVNPIEWWDVHWIEDNVLKKLALLKE